MTQKQTTETRRQQQAQQITAVAVIDSSPCNARVQLIPWRPLAGYLATSPKQSSPRRPLRFCARVRRTSYTKGKAGIAYYTE